MQHHSAHYTEIKAYDYTTAVANFPACSSTQQGLPVLAAFIGLFQCARRRWKAADYAAMKMKKILAPTHT